MYANPKPGERVTLHYRETARPFAPNGRSGVVVKAGKGRPRNHLIELDGGQLVVVPCGNVRKVQ